MASLLYIGAGIGMLAINFLQNEKTREKEARITKKELPYAAAVIALDIAAPIFLLLGLSMTTSATASLLGNFEIAATTAIALIAFKEAIGKRMWVAVSLITLASMILSVEDFANLKFSFGSIFVLLGCVSWGLENNCTRMLSLKNPLHIVVMKGFGSGLGSLLIATFIGGISTNFVYIGFSLLLGFIAYGLSIYFYILAQRNLGASRTSVFYAIAPFVGVCLSFLLFREMPMFSFWIAFAVMAVGAYLAAFEKHEHKHEHVPVEHEHRHTHDDGHHEHIHTSLVAEHSHMHTHTALAHCHTHTPDLHHTHVH